MKRFRQIYVKISVLIYCMVLLIGTLAWLSVRYVFGVVPALILTPVELHTTGFLLLGVVTGITLIQLTAWIISHILHQVTSVRG